MGVTYRNWSAWDSVLVYLGALAVTAGGGYHATVSKEAIQSYLDVVPFTPIDLVTSSGKSYRVPHPDFINFSPTEGVPKRFWLYRVNGAKTHFTTGRRAGLE
jgi:hypothetical protein